MFGLQRAQVRVVHLQGREEAMRKDGWRMRGRGGLIAAVRSDAAEP